MTVPAAEKVYVAPSDVASDDAVGTREAPLATVAEAVRRCRTSQATDTIVLLPGVHRLQKTLVLTREDAGLTIRGDDAEKPSVLTAAVPVTGWRKVEGELPFLPEAAHGKIYATDMPAMLKQSCNTLYRNGAMLPRARSEGVYPTVAYKHGESGNRFEVPVPEGMVHHWPNLQDVEFQVVPGSPWTINILPVTNVVPEENLLVTDVVSTYPMGKPRFGHFPEGSLWIENAFQFLDEPGEWVIDSKAEKIYLWPKSTPIEGVAAPLLTELVRVEGEIDYDGPTDLPVEEITLEHLTFRGGDRFDWKKDKLGWGLQHDWEMFDAPTAMVRFRGAENCRVENCRFIDSGATGLRGDLHCRKVSITGCEFSRLGGCGVLLAGYGPGTKDVNHHNTVSKNRFSRIGTLLWHSPAIFVWQSGSNRIERNVITHTPYTGIVVSGRISWDRRGRGECSKTIRWDEIDPILPPDKPGRPSWHEREPFLHGRNNLVARNDISHVMEILGDGNCIYISGTGGGNLVEENFLHEVTSPRINANLRCDDDQHETILRRNVIARCCGEGFISKGENDILNNIVYDLLPVGEDGVPSVHTRGYLVFPSSSVEGSRIEGNIFFSKTPGQVILHEHQNPRRGPSLLRDCRSDRNVYFNAADPDWAKEFLQKQRPFGNEEHSITQDPRLVAPEENDFRLRDDSPARKLGIESIDVPDLQR
jgi:hypothetical protein